MVPDSRPGSSKTHTPDTRRRLLALFRDPRLKPHGQRGVTGAQASEALPVTAVRCRFRPRVRSLLAACSWQLHPPRVFTWVGNRPWSGRDLSPARQTHRHTAKTDVKASLIQPSTGTTGIPSRLRLPRDFQAPGQSALLLCPVPNGPMSIISQFQFFFFKPHLPFRRRRRLSPPLLEGQCSW